MSEEADIQKAIFKWFKLQYPMHVKSFQASLNGVNLGGNKTNRYKIINALKAQGMCIGQSDIFLAVSRHGFHGKYIELKTTDKKSKPTEEQLEFGDEMVKEGYAFEVAKGFEACRDAIKSYMDN